MKNSNNLNYLNIFFYINNYKLIEKLILIILL